MDKAKPISLNEVKQRKDKIKEEIKNILEEFYLSTGLVITGVEVDNAFFGTERIVINISLEVKL